MKMIGATNRGALVLAALFLFWADHRGLAFGQDSDAAVVSSGDNSRPDQPTIAEGGFTSFLETETERLSNNKPERLEAAKNLTYAVLRDNFEEFKQQNADMVGTVLDGALERLKDKNGHRSVRNATATLLACIVASGTRLADPGSENNMIDEMLDGIENALQRGLDKPTPGLKREEWKDWQYDSAWTSPYSPPEEGKDAAYWFLKVIAEGILELAQANEGNRGMAEICWLRGQRILRILDERPSQSHDAKAAEKAAKGILPPPIPVGQLAPPGITRWFAILALYPGLPLLAWGLLFWVHPAALISAAEGLKKCRVVLPEWLGKVEAPLQVLLLIPLFAYRHRVLDAWVRCRLDDVRQRFQLTDTVRDRQIHVPLPARREEGGHGIRIITAADFRTDFMKYGVCVLIWGDGGSGKTSLACQIASWGMAENRSDRLHEHVMLPVLIEDELSNTLVTEIDGQLQALVGRESRISQDLLVRLLRSGRILVIIDGLSEMSAATREKIRLDSPECPIDVAVVTSRSPDLLRRIPNVKLETLPINKGKSLLGFLEEYLRLRSEANHSQKVEISDEIRDQLDGIRSDELPVLFAKLYADCLVLAGSSAGEEAVPQNLPELVLAYLRQLNRKIDRENRLPDEVVHRNAMAMAFACVSDKWRPYWAPWPAVADALGNGSAEQLFDYFENRLRLVERRDTVDGLRVRFGLDPLAEYLAAMYLIRKNRDDMAAWRDDFESFEHEEAAERRVGRDDSPPEVDQLAHSDKEEAVQHFLAVLEVCCEAREANEDVRDFVQEEAANRRKVRELRKRKPR